MFPRLLFVMVLYLYLYFHFCREFLQKLADSCTRKTYIFQLISNTGYEFRIQIKRELVFVQNVDS